MSKQGLHADRDYRFYGHFSNGVVIGTNTKTFTFASIVTRDYDPTTKKKPVSPTNIICLHMNRDAAVKKAREIIGRTIFDPETRSWVKAIHSEVVVVGEDRSTPGEIVWSWDRPAPKAMPEPIKAPPPGLRACRFVTGMRGINSDLNHDLIGWLADTFEDVEVIHYIVRDSDAGATHQAAFYLTEEQAVMMKLRWPERDIDFYDDFDTVKNARHYDVLVVEVVA